MAFTDLIHYNPHCFPVVSGDPHRLQELKGNSRSWHSTTTEEKRNVTRVNPDACSPVSKASHTHGNAHTIKKLLWEKSAGLSPWMTELQESM